MINDHIIVAGTFLTNAIEGGYYPTSRYCLNSLGKADYVDTVLVSEAGSIDNTIELHSDIPKVVWTHPKEIWDINSFSYLDTERQYTALFDWCRSQNKKIILTINWCDAILNDVYRNDLYSAIDKFTKSNNTNYMFLPGGVKVFCKKLRTIEYGTPNGYFSVLSAYKFGTDCDWTDVVNDGKCYKGKSNAKRFHYDWKSTYYGYEMLTFTKRHLEMKIKKHCEWNNKLSVDDIIKEKLLDKAYRIGTRDMTIDDHPEEIKQFVSNLTDEYYGFSCFGHVK